MCTSRLNYPFLVLFASCVLAPVTDSRAIRDVTQAVRLKPNTSQNVLKVSGSVNQSMDDSTDQFIACRSRIQENFDNLNTNASNNISSADLPQMCLRLNSKHEEDVKCVEAGLDKYCQSAEPKCDQREIWSDLKNDIANLCQNACPNFRNVEKTVLQCWKSWSDIGTAQEDSRFLDFCRQLRENEDCLSRATSNCSGIFSSAILVASMAKSLQQGAYAVVNEEAQAVCPKDCPDDILRTASECVIILSEIESIMAEKSSNVTSLCQKNADKCLESDEGGNGCPTVSFLMKRFNPKYKRSFRWLNEECQKLMVKTSTTATPELISATSTIVTSDTTTATSTTAISGITATISSAADISTKNIKEKSSEFEKQILYSTTNEIYSVKLETTVWSTVPSTVPAELSSTSQQTARMTTTNAGLTKEMISGNGWVPCRDQFGESRSAAPGPTPCFLLVTAATIGDWRNNEIWKRTKLNRTVL